MKHPIYNSLLKMQLFDKNTERLLVPIAIALIVSLSLLLLRSSLLRCLQKKTHSSLSLLRDTFIAVARNPSVYWCIAFGFYAGIEFSDLSPQYSKSLFRFIHVLLILSITLALSNLSVSLFYHFLRKTHGSTQSSGLTIGMIKGAVFALGLSVILPIFGVSLAPLLTALGVGGIALALALKDTLENIFAGISLLTDRTIRVGDFVRLDSGKEGKVQDIGWRTTKIESSSNYTTIIPNSKMAQSVVTNFCIPEKKMEVSISVVVNATNNMPQVEELLLQLAKKGSEDIAGILSSPSPNVRFTQIGSDGTVTFLVNFHVKEYTDQSFATHELRKRVFSQLIKQGFTFPVALSLR